MITSSPRIMGNMRNIGNLSLDMNYPGLGSPASPSSPSYSSLPSPTFSGSWNQNKSQAELTSLLKEAYNSLKDKERDLMLAAEVGKSLLENNIALKSQYDALKSQCETLAIQAQQLQRERIRATTFMLQAQSADKPNIPAIAPPRDALESSLIDNIPDFEESDSDSNAGWSTSVDFKNSLISQDLSRKNKREQDLQYYQEAHGLATQKIEELEKDNSRLLQKTRTEFWNTRLHNKSNVNANDTIVDELLQKIRDLEDQNNTVERAKSEIERRFNRVTQDLEILQEQYNELAEASNGFEILQVVNREQELHILELTESLEEQRAVVASVQSGMYSRQPSRSSSFSEGGMMSKALKRLSNPDSLNLFGSMGTNKRTLLSELESEWFKNIQTDNKALTDPNDGLFSPSLSALGDDDISQLDYLSDDEFSFLDELDDDDELAMRKREWFWRRWLRSFYNFLRWVWRWCRFLVVLVAAVIMALYRGPDHILPHEV
ncbi:8309_t:CDS:2 [Diversispora eburnea]|uniref:8309_t:CDS:1 n=1 Tax=Diversispora eburnea TaxID=1213867 RepID=A0A9N8VD91_9GLOM|nr:8309_t:CDS:2 [Diversispora eburnea]